MPLTLAQMLALLPDNTAGDIAAVDVRDVVTALSEGVLPPTVGPDDDYWTATSLDGSWVEVNPSGTQTLTVSRGRLSVLHDDIATADIGAIVKPLTGEGVGSSLTTDLRHMALFENYTMGGLVFSDGTAVGSNVATLLFYLTNAGHVLETRGGTFQAVGATVQGGPALHTAAAGNPFMRWTWQASNSFRAEFSPDGRTWFTFAMADSGITLTPTHGGIFWSGWGATTPRITSFGPFVHDAP